MAIRTGTIFHMDALDRFLVRLLVVLEICSQVGGLYEVIGMVT